MPAESPAQGKDPILVVESIIVRYETAEGPIVAVDDVSFTRAHQAGVKPALFQAPRLSGAAMKRTKSTATSALSTVAAPP